jgi:CHAT domain-containing protein/uncharacterized protein YjbI with pentapeptide repeats
MSKAPMSEPVMHAGEKLDGQDFSGQTLNGANFRNASLKKASFRNCNLSSADFSGADLTDATLEAATAFGAKFVGASLVRVHAAGANLSYGDFTDADLQEADLSGVEFEEALGPRANFDRANLRRCAFFSGHYEKATLRQADLTEARLYGADFTAADFSRARLVGVRSSETVLDDARFDGALVARDEAEVGAGKDVLSVRNARLSDNVDKLVALQQQYLAQPSAELRRAFADAWQALFEEPGFQSMPGTARTQARVDAAMVFLQAFETSGDGEDLAFAMEQCRLAVLELPAEEAAARSALVQMYAQQFLKSYRSTRRIEYPAQGAPWLLRVLGEIDMPAGQQAEQLYEFGNELRFLRSQAGDPRLIDVAVDCHRRATQLADPKSPRLPEYWDTLAMDLHRRYGDRQHEVDLDEAIAAWKEAVRLAHGIDGFNASHLADYRINLAQTCDQRFERAGQLADLDVASGSLEDALRESSPGRTSADAVLSLLTRVLLQRHERSHDIADLDRLIATHRRLLDQEGSDTPPRIDRRLTLAQLVASRFDEMQHADDLNAAIGILRPALDGLVEQRSLADFDEAQAAGYLARLLHVRSQRSGNGADLEMALAWSRRALDATPSEEAAFKGTLYANLARQARQAYMQDKQRALLDEAIDAGRRSLTLLDADDEERPRVKAGLGGDVLLKASAERDEADRASLDEAIGTLRAAIDEGEQGGTVQPGWLHNFASALRLRFHLHGEPADAAAAVDAWRRALKLQPTDVEDAARMFIEMMTEAPAELAEASLSKLPGVAQLLRWTRDGLAQAVRAGDAGKAAMLRFALCGQLTALDPGPKQEPLEEAIALGEDLLVHGVPLSPRDVDVVHDLLCRAYARRSLGSHASNLEAAVRHGEAALARNDSEDSEHWPEFRAARHTNLASAYFVRGHGERAENIELALRHTERALEVRTRERYPYQWAMLQNMLGMIFLERRYGDAAANVDRAITHFESSIEVRTREDYPEKWADTVTNLANAYRRCKGGDAAGNLEKAIDLYRRTLDVRTREAYPTQWLVNEINLATSYLDRVAGTPADHARLAMEGLRRAAAAARLDVEPSLWGNAFHNLAEATLRIGEGGRKDVLNLSIEHYLHALQGFTADAFPAEHLNTQQRLGETLFELGSWDDAHKAFTAAAAASNALYTESFTEVGRRAELAKIGQLHSLDAWCLLQLGRFDSALERLERGKTRVLSEALALDAAALGRLDAAERDAIGIARDAVRALENQMRSPAAAGKRDDRALADALAHARRELAASIQQARAAFPAFMPDSPAVTTILQGIPAGSALVAPVLTPAGTAVFVVPAGAQAVDPEHVLRLDFDDAALHALLAGDRGWLPGYFSRDAHPAVWRDTIAATGRQLWNGLMGPIADRLAQLGIRRALLMPQGGLGLLPLHAAWCEGAGARRYFIDDCSVTYVAGAAVQKLCAERLHRARTGGAGDASLLAVVDPTHDLPYAPLEGEDVARAFRIDRVTVLPGDAATPGAVRQAAATHVHFACHGHYDWSDPMRSALRLAAGAPLSLAQVMGELRFERMQLVVLSACETGISDIRATPDEYVGLPAGFLLAGAPAVVSTLWAVNDLSTALLMGRFYALLFDGKHDAAAALNVAQRWLRNVTAGELTRRFADEEEAVLAGAPSAAVEAIAASFTRFARQAPAVRPFQDPFYWAAFTYMGV